jgi:hypothetical protein
MLHCKFCKLIEFRESEKAQKGKIINMEEKAEMQMINGKEINDEIGFDVV